MAYTFRYLPRGSAIGTGAYVFRHFGSEQPLPPPVELPYLCFTAKEANSTVAMEANDDGAPAVSLEYSTNGNAWSPFVVGTTTVTLANVGDKMWMRGDNTRLSSDVSVHNNFFVMTGKIAASGNIMSLLDKTVQSVTIAESSCFSKLFIDCASLTTAPELPATTLTSNCYTDMFRGCTSLITAPELPATTLVNGCYNTMFLGCTSLASVSVRFSTFGPNPYTASYTSNWLSSVPEVGTFICPSSLKTTKRGASYVPSGWTVVNV